MSRKIEMKFSCDQDWNSMSECAEGKFCNQCDKIVHDFTRKKQADLHNFLAENENVCGMFSPEQLDESLIPITNFIPTRKIVFASLLASLGFGVVNAQVTDSVKVEQVDSVKSCNKEHKQQITLSEREKESQRKRGYTYYNSDRYTYYVSWKFPFLHRRKKVRILGCPSF